MQQEEDQKSGSGGQGNGGSGNGDKGSSGNGASGKDYSGLDDDEELIDMEMDDCSGEESDAWLRAVDPGDQDLDSPIMML